MFSSEEDEEEEEAMTSKKVFIRLADDVIIKTCEWMGATRIDVRRYWRSDRGKEYPTKSGVSLTLYGFKRLCGLLQSIQTAIRQHSKIKLLVEGNIYVCTDETASVQMFYWNAIAPTKGLTFTQCNWDGFVAAASAVEEIVTELKDMTLCDDEHYNQEGFWACGICNPVNYFEG